MNLEDAATGTTLTSREFDGVVGDLFTIEDQTHAQLVAGLNVAQNVRRFTLEQFALKAL